MKQNKGLQLAYLADGCITISKHAPRAQCQQKSPNYRVGIHINQVDGRMLDYIKGIFGGKIYVCKQYGHGNATVYRWEIVSQDKAQALLKLLAPFLRYKKKQAEYAYQFCCLKNRQEKDRLRRMKESSGTDIIGRSKPVRKLTNNQLKEREDLFLKIKKEKHTFVPSAAVETKRSESSKDGKR